MKTPKLFIFVLLLSCCCGTLSLVAAPKTLDEINEEREQKAEDEKKALKESCNNNSGKACFRFAESFANEDEKLLYFSKACELEYQQGCEEANKIKAAQEAEKARLAEEERLKQEAEKARLAEEEKRKAKAEEERMKEEQRKAEEEKRKAEKEKERQIKEEINKAGRKKRIAIATGVFVPGLALIGGGAASLYMMSDAQKWHDKYYKKYLSANDNFTADKYRKKTKTAGDHAQLYKILGSVGIGLGAAMVTTGIVFYSIEFKEEKEVKKKYNVSIGASPMDGTLQFAFRW